MSNKDVKGLYGQWIEMWNGNFDLAEEIISHDFVIHQERIDEGKSEDLRGPEGIVQMIQEGRAPFTDVTFTIKVGPITERDKVSGRWIFQGNYRGGIPGATAPEGKKVEFKGNDILRIESGKFVEYWVCSDGIHLMSQLGVIPS